MALAADLLKGAFGYQPKNPALTAPVPAPLPMEPEKKAYNTRDSVTRDNPLPTAAAVQSMVWGNSSPGPGEQGAPQPGPPPMGLAQNMDTSKGWGKTVG